VSATVSIIVPSFNTRDVLLRALRSVTALDHGVLREIIVVDNGSVDGSADAVAAQRPDVRLIRNPTNRGFAVAANQGLRAAEGSYYLLLNSDTDVSSPFLGALVTYLENHRDVAVVAPRLIYPDGRDQGTARRFPTAWAFLFGRRSPLTRLWPSNPFSARYLVGRRHAGGAPFEVDSVSGACMLVRPAAIRDVGLLDEGFFMYWEDVDWCRRFRDSGWRVCCLPQVSVVHHEGLSSGARVRLTIEFHRSVFRYICKHHGRQHWVIPFAAAALTLRAACLLLVRAIHPSPALR
jgi:GT2 family glycosyltransferase